MENAQQLQEISERLARLAAVNGELVERLAATGNGGPVRRAAAPAQALVPVVVARDGKTANDATDVLVAAVQTGIAVALSSNQEGWMKGLAFAPALFTLLDNGVDGQGIEATLLPAAIGGASLLVGRLVR